MHVTYMHFVVTLSELKRNQLNKVAEHVWPPCTVATPLKKEHLAKLEVLEHLPQRQEPCTRGEKIYVCCR